MEWKAVINFWFRECTPRDWFKKNAAFDTKIRKRFLRLYEMVVKGETAQWRTSAQGRLAEVIVLDQFARNMFRGKPRAFAHDALALALAQEAIRAGADKKLTAAQRRFLYMPFMHSESKKIQKESLKLFKSLGGTEAAKYAIAHKHIIDRFGRFPHRNMILGRKSAAAETKFLRTNSGF